MLPELPGMQHELMRRALDERLILKTHSEQMSLIQAQLERNARRQNSLVLAGLLLAAGLITAHSDLAHGELAGGILYAASALSVIAGWFKSRQP